MRNDGPSCLIFSRQNLAHQPRNEQQVADIARGGYVLKDSVGAPEIILIATGSEVDLAMKAAAQLGDKARARFEMMQDLGQHFNEFEIPPERE